MKFNNYHVGKEIHRLLGESGLSQKQFARRIGVQLSVLKYYFTRPELSLPVLRRLSVALNTDLILPFISRESMSRLQKGSVEEGEEKDGKRANGSLSQDPSLNAGALTLEVEALRRELETQKALLEELREWIARQPEKG